MIATAQFLFLFETLIFGAVIFMHVSKKSYSVIALYVIQSIVVVMLLYGSSLSRFSAGLLLAAVVTFAVKVIFAPYFFHRLIAKHQLRFTASTYLNVPVTLVVIALLTGAAYSHVFAGFALLAPENGKALLLAFAAMLLSLFLIVNRKGALSQMVGILSLENSIVSFAFLAGLEQAPPLQIAVLFDITVWVIIAGIFASMVYTSFGTLDVTSMRHLTEE